MDSIIQKMRKLNTVFKQSSTCLIPLQELCEQLSNSINSNIYLFLANGEILCYAIADAFHCIHNQYSLKDPQLPQHYRDLFHASDDSHFNTYEEPPICTCEGMDTCIFENRYYSIVPVFCNFQKIAGILLIRYDGPYAKDEEVLCEYTSAIISLELMRQEQERIKQESLEIARCQLAVSSLTFSELTASAAVLELLPQDAGVVVLNSLVEKIYVTDSMISSALKKLESAGVIAAKTMGVKGKYIRIVNPHLRHGIQTALSAQNTPDAPAQAAH